MPLFLHGILALSAVLGFAEAKAKAPRANPVEAALLALDTDHSGKVERAEIEAFAQSKGLSLEQIKGEFASIDKNGNGELEASEIQTAIAGSDSSPSVQQAVQQTVQLPETQQTLQQQTVELPEMVMPARSVQSAAAAVQVQNKPVAMAPDTKAQEPAINTQDLEVTAEMHAEHVVAQLFEQKAASALAAMREDSNRAKTLQKTARALRGQADEVRQGLAQETANAAKTATDAVLDKADKQVKMMESEISLAEQKASQYRELSKDAMNSAIAAQSEISNEIQLIKSQQSSS